MPSASRREEARDAHGEGRLRLRGRALRARVRGRPSRRRLQRAPGAHAARRAWSPTPSSSTVMQRSVPQGREARGGLQVRRTLAPGARHRCSSAGFTERDRPAGGLPGRAILGPAEPGWAPEGAARARDRRPRPLLRRAEGRRSERSPRRRRDRRHGRPRARGRAARCSRGGARVAVPYRAAADWDALRAAAPQGRTSWAPAPTSRRGLPRRAFVDEAAARFLGGSTASPPSPAPSADGRHARGRARRRVGGA